MSTTRKRRAERTRQAILDAAREIISERGAYNLSLREIARRIDYSPAGLYEYFGSKDEIVVAVVQEGFGRFATYLGDVPNDQPALDYLLELGKSYVRFASENPQHFMLIFNTTNLYQSDHSLGYISDGTFGLLIRGLERAIEEGAMPADTNVMAAAYGAWGIVHGMATLRLTQISPEQYDLDTATEIALRMWNHGLTAGIQTMA